MMDEYRRDCAGLVNVKRFDALDVDSKNLVIYDGSPFERDTAWGAWKTRWAMLSRWCVGILVDTRSAGLTVVWFEQELFYCRRLRDAIDANMKGAEKDSELQCWFFNNPYTNMYCIHGGTHRTKPL